MKKILAISAGLVTVILLSVLVSGIAVGSENGSKTGLFATGCGAGIGCHSPANGTPGAVIIDGPATMAAGQTATFNVKLVALPLGPVGGIDAAVVDGSGAKAGGMAAVSNVQVKFGNEVTHVPTMNIPAVGNKPVNERMWSFNWTAPSAPGTYTLKVAGNAANGDGKSNTLPLPAGVNDTWYLGEQGITVESVPALP